MRTTRYGHCIASLYRCKKDSVRETRFSWRPIAADALPARSGPGRFWPCRQMWNSSCQTSRGTLESLLFRPMKTSTIAGKAGGRHALPTQNLETQASSKARIPRPDANQQGQEDHQQQTAHGAHASGRIAPATRYRTGQPSIQHGSEAGSAFPPGSGPVRKGPPGRACPAPCTRRKAG